MSELSVDLYWRPIATAPKDEPVLLYSEDWEMTLGDVLVGFVDHDGRCVVAETDDYNATHWMPLPEPPDDGQ